MKQLMLLTETIERGVKFYDSVSWVEGWDDYFLWIIEKLDGMKANSMIVL